MASNLRHAGNGDAKPGRYCSPGMPLPQELSDLHDIRFPQLGAAVLLPPTDARGVPPRPVVVSHRSALLFGLVPHVVGLRPKKQMAQAHTGPRVAAVKNLKSVWDRSIFKLPRYPVNKKVTSRLVRSGSGGPIAIPELLPRPDVAWPKVRTMRRDRSVEIDLGEETFSDSLAGSQVAPPCDSVRGRRRENVGDLAHPTMGVA